MLATRVIPCLLLHHQGLVKTVRFRKPKYVGDPVNAIRIFNEKEVDELVLLDISATAEGRQPQYRLLSEIAGECFMPLAYGGGIRTLEDVRTVLGLGAEKVIVNTQAVEDPDFLRRAADLVGSQSVVVSIDCRKDLFGRDEVRTRGGRKRTGLDPVEWAVRAGDSGAGEILLNSIDRDGTMSGYDIDLLCRVSKAVRVPVVACGGAGRLEDFSEAIRKGGASAVSAGSMFVFQGPHRAVLISYPSQGDLRRILG